VTATVPWPGSEAPVMVRVSPGSASLSLSRTGTSAAGALRATLRLSLTATGTSFTGVIVIDTVAMSAPPCPSEIV
jgi:hypothetical protein